VRFADDFTSDTLKGYRAEGALTRAKGRLTLAARTLLTRVLAPGPREVHQLLLVRHGIYNLENLDLEEPARDRAYEFAFIFAPLRLKGATRSPGNPIAVR